MQWYCLEAERPVPFPRHRLGTSDQRGDGAEKCAAANGTGKSEWSRTRWPRPSASAITACTSPIPTGHISKTTHRSGRIRQQLPRLDGARGREARKPPPRRRIRAPGAGLTDFVVYPDGCVSTSWYIDNHEPDPENSKHFREPFLSRGCLRPLDFYPIPYRCFYPRTSTTCSWRGGTSPSATSPLGTTRVMRTTAMMGEVVGPAARVCLREGLCRATSTKKLSTNSGTDGQGRRTHRRPYLQVYTLIDTTAARSEEC